MTHPKIKLPEKLIMASSNAGKLREFQALLADCDFTGRKTKVIPQSELSISSAEETGLSFIENAILKARHAAAQSGCAALADDSGIAVDALSGAPGIYSARYAGPAASDLENNNKLLAELVNIPDNQRTARYICVIALVLTAHDPTPIICEGRWEGLILSEPSGTGGFGYDPLFFLSAYNCTAAELDPAEKNRISHRGLAMAKLRKFFS